MNDGLYWSVVEPKAGEGTLTYTTCAPLPEIPFPKKVISSGMKTIVFWKDGSKTTVTCMDGDNHNVHDAIVQAFFKKMLGNSTKKRGRWMKAALKRVKIQTTKTKKKPTSGK